MQLESESYSLGQFWEALDGFRSSIQAANYYAFAAGSLSEKQISIVRHAFSILLETSEAALQAVPKLRGVLSAELLPHVLLSDNARRWHDKPCGYAGDFMSIELIYRDIESGRGSIGTLLDRCFLDLPAASAVKNRRSLLAREIARTVARVLDRPARVTSLAAGPARELLDYLSATEDPAPLHANLVDIDKEALSFVAAEAHALGKIHQLSLNQANLVHVIQGRRALEISDQDLIYSIGLVDYFEDPLVIKLLDWIYDHLRPGGRVFLGNFHPDNPNRGIMDHVLNWRLIHRDEKNMARLFSDSKFGKPPTRIVFEETGINLFAEGVR